MNRSDIHFPARHEALREDVHALATVVGQMLRDQGGDVLLELVDQDRINAIRQRGGEGSTLELEAHVKGRDPAVARDLVRAFSSWFQAVNLAEKVHRIRRRSAYFQQDGTKPQPGGVEDALTTLKQQGLTLEQVLDLLQSLRIEPVFAAHPTESTRRTILRKQLRIAGLLLDRLNPTLTPTDTRELWSRIRAEITASWQTEDHPREKLTVADEREHVLFYLVEILYPVIPAFYDEIAQALSKLYDVAPESLEIPTIVRFGTWVGGDLDGHPDVHAKTIRETLARQQQVIINAYFEECQDLAQKLSQSASRISVSADLSKRIDEYFLLLPGARAITPARHDRMPYRVFLAQIAERLRQTYEGRPNGYQNLRQFRADVMLIMHSLLANKGLHAGLDLVERFVRRIDTFGFHLATLDVRQDSAVFQQVIAQGFDDPDWISRTAAERIAALSDAIERDLGPRAVELDATGKRTLSVFESFLQSRHRYGPDAVGYFIAGHVSGPDDVLAMLLLARWAECYDKRTGEVPFDFAPMFETIEPLEHCGATMRTLLDIPLYRRHLEARGRRQCVLVGYSESNKEGGFLASRFAVYAAQRELAVVLAAHHESHVMFHARGGSTPRGGGRVDVLLRSVPAAAVNNVLRFTEEGEVVNQSYGLHAIAMRTLERAFSALCQSASDVRRGQLNAVDADNLVCAETLALGSRVKYRELVERDPSFATYFRHVTPIDVIERMQIGSRPAYRSSDRSLDFLRPVPWVFAWTQSRHLLPGWYGAGTGLQEAVARHGMPALQRAYQMWFFFRNLIDDLEAMLARTDLEIARVYDSLAPASLQNHALMVRQEYQLACAHVLELKGEKALLDGEPTLQRSIQLRNPYVDPMNLMQVDLLQRWRASDRQDRDLFDGLLASISGIAQGLQSTG